jgi:membrane protein DedA with SNARE-associated domain
LAGTGVLDPWVLSAWAIPGAALGDAVSYWFGYYFRNSIPKIWPFTSYPKLLESGRAFFARWGVLSVFLGRFMGPLRAVVPLVAGMMEMPHRAFQIANVTSAIIWAPVVFFQGALMGIALKWLSDQLGVEALIALAVGLGIAGVIGWLGFKKLRQRKKSKIDK